MSIFLIISLCFILSSKVAIFFNREVITVTEIKTIDPEPD